MTYPGVFFSLTSTAEPTRAPGWALLCLDARYLSVLWNGAEQVERTSLSLAHWTEIGELIGVALLSTATASSIVSAQITEARSSMQDFIGRTVAPSDSAIAVRHWLSVLINVPRQENAEASLDALLLSASVDLQRQIDTAS